MSISNQIPKDIVMSDITDFLIRTMPGDDDDDNEMMKMMEYDVQT